MKSAASVLATALLAGTQSAFAVTDEFDEDALVAFRDEVRALMLSGAGLNKDNDRVSAFDTVFDNELPLMASSVRLGFHDCAGEFPTKCDGCLDLDSKANAGLDDGSVGPLTETCDKWKEDYQLSTADCWALTATFALELSTQRAQEDWTYMNDFLQQGLDSDDFPKGAVNPGDIPYYVGRVDCETTPSVADGVQEALPTPGFNWVTIQEYFNNRFGFSDKETIALIAGGHSMGRGHGLITVGSGPWDVSPNTVDNEYSKALLGQNRMLDNWNWLQGRYIGGPGPRTWFVENPDFTDIYGEPFTVDTAFLMINSDINLAFDTSYYSDLRIPVTCRTLATEYCESEESGTRVLYPGESIDDYPGETACTQVQCPLLCPNGQAGLDAYIANGYDNVAGDCPVAYVQQFANDEDEWIESFVSAYTTVITAGYEPNGKCGDSSDSSSDDSDDVAHLDYICEVDVDYGELDSSSSSSSSDSGSS